MRSIIVPVLVLSSALLMACEEGPRPPLRTAVSPPFQALPAGAQAATWMTFQSPAAMGDSTSPTTGSIQIDGRILQACGDLPTAHFAFDSVAITGGAAEALGALARCFVSGPLAGARLHLVGHADPRGGVAYNLALGHQRAGSVATFLLQRGLTEDRVGTVSKGDFEASGSDEHGWALDRKVEVFLAD
jgi:peptidoglycan-associated lipoprotein